MNRKIALATLVLPVGMIAFAKSASAAKVRSVEVSQAPMTIAQRYDDQRIDERIDQRIELRREAIQREQARREALRRDEIRQREAIRRDQARRVWIPGHYEPGFLGIGRKWVEGHWENR